MSDAMIVALIKYALETLMWITAPMLIAAIVVGVVISFVQTLTSIQDQTFALAPRLMTILMIFLLTFPWALRILITFTTALFSDFKLYIK